mmetsp:Transcript_22982/g.40703  ORF Transcript_22982/g.40703 Transcript_22982/m.40703 type:complete len:430 (+) Transcript_22982:201-1490(+)
MVAWKRWTALSRGQTRHNVWSRGKVREMTTDAKMLAEYANKSQTPVGMRTLIDIGKGKLLRPTGRANWMVDYAPPHVNRSTLPLEMSRDEVLRLSQRQLAAFLRRELPVRFAHRARELARAPYGLGEMPSIQNVKTWYEKSFEEVVSFDEELLFQTETGNEKFKETLREIYTRHQDTLVMVAKGLHELRSSPRGMEILQSGKDLSDLKDIHAYLDRFFLSRIGIRILIGQYLELYEPQQPDYVGLICMKTSAASVAQAAAEDARYMCERTFGDAPAVEMLGRVDLTFPYVPSHLYYILFELLKNSMRATIETHGLVDIPEVRVVIADGESNEDVVIRISDQGGGIPRSISDKVFSYLFTTARDAFAEEHADLEDFGRENPLAGLGYGLPISRGYVRYFRGDLQLMSMHGYGTDAFVHLPRLAGDREPLL